MRKTIMAVVVAVLPTRVAAAEPSSQQPRKPPTIGTLPPVKGNPCAAFGPGFVKVDGSSTCVKVGGSVGVDAGVTR
jgi:hypothetical protein